MDWADSGETLLFGGNGSWTLRIGEDSQPEPLFETGDNETDLTISPNRRWVSYVSDASGERQVYVRPFPDVNSGGQRLISDGPAEDPLWGPNGQELFYLTAVAAIVVPVNAGDTFQRGTSQRLFSLDPYFQGPARSWGHFA